VSDIEKVEIGLATLYRGDCLEATKLIDVQVDLSLCDPPYEESMHTADRMVKAGVEGWGTKTEAHKFGAMDEHTRSEITRLMVEKTKGWLMIFCQSEGIYYWKNAIEQHGGKYRFTGAWVKPSSKPNLSGDSPGLGFETVVSGWCGGGKSRWNGGGKAAVWTHNPAKRTADNTHTSIKPHSLMVELVGLFSNEGQTVLDTFMGSGSTGVAAVALGRKFIGIERDPEYFNICCRRIEEAQKGDMFANRPYVKTKSKIAVQMFEELTPKPPKVAAPKARAAPVARKVAAPVAVTAAPPEARKRFAPPSIKSTTAPKIDKDDSKPRLPARTIPASFEPILRAAAGRLIDFGPWADAPGSGGAVGLDVECFPNWFLINFERFSNGEKISFEMSDRSQIDFARVKKILTTECIITFNGMVYDVPMIAMAMKGVGLQELKYNSNELIGDKVKYWQVEDRFRIRLPSIDHVDLFEPNPAVKTGLKTLSGRLHNKLMMNLPFKHDTYMSHEQMNVGTLYCFNDLADTKSLFRALREPLQLRVALTKKYDIDMRSKSDAQVGEAIVKKRVAQITGERVRKGSGMKFLPS
jgi:site-specific DNA-methyltransferase (adenine-specific)